MFGYLKLFLVLSLIVPSEFQAKNILKRGEVLEVVFNTYDSENNFKAFHFRAENILKILVSKGEIDNFLQHLLPSISESEVGKKILIVINAQGKIERRWFELDVNATLFGITLVTRYPDGDAMAGSIATKQLEYIILDHQEIQSRLGDDFGRVWHTGSWQSNPTLIFKHANAPTSPYCQKTGHMRDAIKSFDESTIVIN